MIEVESSNIKSIGYDEPRRRLCVEFLKLPGVVYIYAGVSLNTYRLVMGDDPVPGLDTLGKRFNSYIKAGGYRFEVERC